MNAISILITIAIAVLQVFAVIIPLNGKLSDNRFSGFKKFTKRGKQLMACCAATAILTIALYFISEAEKKAEAKILNDQLDNCDEKHAKIADSTAKVYIKLYDQGQDKITKNFAKYGLKYIESEGRIEKLVIANDSIRGVPDPDFSIPVGGIKIDTLISDNYSFQITFKCSNANLYNLRSKVYVFVEQNKVIQLLNKKPVYLLGQGISMNDNTLLLPKINNIPAKETDAIIIYYMASYENSRGKKFTLNKVHAFVIGKNNTAIPNHEQYNEVKEILRKNKIYDRKD